MEHSQLSKLGVAIAFAAAAALMSSLLYGYRDEIFAWDWARSHGRFQATIPPELVTAARDLAESREHGAACVVAPLGRDDSFLFVQLGCGRFQGEPPNVREIGEPEPTATRLRYRGSLVSDLERPAPDAYENSLRRLFPREAFERLRLSGMARSDYLGAGLARMKAKNLAAVEDPRH